MQFIANYDAKNVFGCFENVEQHALAFSEEAAAKPLNFSAQNSKPPHLWRLAKSSAARRI